MTQLLEMAGAVLETYLESFGCDGLGSNELEGLLSQYGLIVEAPATTEDVESDWGSDIGLEKGDLVYKPTELGKSALQAMRSSNQRELDSLTGPRKRTQENG